MLVAQREKMVVELQKMRERTDEFNDYVDLDQMTQYVQDVRSVQKRLTEVVEQIKWIHHEEALYKYPLTEFHEVDDIASSLDIFHRLFLVVSKWQRGEKK